MDGTDNNILFMGSNPDGDDGSFFLEPPLGVLVKKLEELRDHDSSEAGSELENKSPLCAAIYSIGVATKFTKGFATTPTQSIGMTILNLLVEIADKRKILLVLDKEQLEKHLKLKPFYHKDGNLKLRDIVDTVEFLNGHPNVVLRFWKNPNEKFYAMHAKFVSCTEPSFYWSGSSNWSINGDEYNIEHGVFSERKDLYLLADKASRYIAKICASVNNIRMDEGSLITRQEGTSNEGKSRKRIAKLRKKIKEAVARNKKPASDNSDHNKPDSRATGSSQTETTDEVQQTAKQTASDEPDRPDSSDTSDSDDS